jgi:hypothetical protein
VRNLFRVWPFTVFMLILASAPAWAVNITSATIDYNANQITITGKQFSLHPTVVFCGKKLTMVGSPTQTKITAHLPDGITEGTYELRVTDQLGQTDRYEVTYGVGPSGPQGPAGPQGAQGPQGVAGPAGTDGAPATPSPSAMRAALLQWYPSTYSSGGYPPSDVAFDGANMWVSNYATPGTVTKLKASDGTNLGTYSVGTYPVGIAFDGANIWVTNAGDNTVTKLRASDGSNMWVANNVDSTVTKVRANDGFVLGTYGTVSLPKDVAFDGANIWVTIVGNATVMKIPAQ